MRRILSFVLLAFAVGCGGDDGGSGDPPIEGPRPAKRSDISGVFDPSSGQLVVFGGDTGPIVNQLPMPEYLDDTWLLDPMAGTWTEVDASGPSARGRYAAALDPAGSRMLLFGGRFRAAGTGGAYTLYDDLWAFDFGARTWTELDAGGSGPSPRIFATSVYDPGADKLYLFGGSTSTDGAFLDPSDEVWSYSGGTWTLETTAGTAPSSRVFHAYTYDPQRNRLVVFGGQVGDFVSPSLGDLYALDLSTMTWSQLDSGTGPSGRFLGMLTYDSDQDLYLMMGGHADPGVANDVWAFSPTAGAWAQLASGDSFTGEALGCLGNPREIPIGYVNEDLNVPERRQAGVLAYHDGRMLVFGGESDCSDHLDDVWSLDTSTGTWTERLAARSGESCARRQAACQCLCL
ncbi:MAG: hypothetical protein KJO07_09830 [Deltaproteobacteria bacterium]|nr:hypothetical protein [Deltaproteobacteria bacterium]